MEIVFEPGNMGDGFAQFVAEALGLPPLVETNNLMPAFEEAVSYLDREAPSLGLDSKGKSFGVDWNGERAVMRLAASDDPDAVHYVIERVGGGAAVNGVIRRPSSETASWRVSRPASKISFPSDMDERMLRRFGDSSE